MRPIPPPTGFRPVGLRRGRPAWIGLVVLLVIAVLVGVDAARLRAGGEPYGDHVVVACLQAGLALVVLLALLTLGNRLPQWRLDDEGIALWAADGRAAEAPWSQVRGVAVTRAVPRWTAGRVWGPRSQTHLEVFLDPRVTRVDHPRAGSFWRTDEARVPGAEPPYLAMYAPGVTRSDLADQVERWATGRWLGVHNR